LAALLLAAPMAAQASTVTLSNTNFNAFAPGTVNGQGGWGITGGFDQQVVNLSGNQALRLSNRTTSGSFGDQLFAPRPGGTTMTPANPTNGNPGFFAGEPSTGATHRRFYAEFDIRSVLTTTDPGARITLSPDNGQGARQGILAFRDTGTNVAIDTFDVTATGTFGPQVTIATMNYAAWTKIGVEVLFLAGPLNDIVNYYVDGVLVHTQRSWEQFYAVNQPLDHPNGAPVQTLLFRMSGTAAQNAQGFYIDNVLIQAGAIPTAVPAPGAITLLGLGLLGLLAARRRA
jgi:hypothetical protein